MRRKSLGYKTSGGEGGIRTLGTGVSPYNGLANESSLAALTRFKDLQSDSGPPSRAQGFSFGSYCAPLCAPTSYSCRPTTIGIGLWKSQNRAPFTAGGTQGQVGRKS